MKSNGIIIQARSSSKRLPKKVLLPLGKTNVLGFLLERINCLKNDFNIVVATTNKDFDNDIEVFCKKNKTKCFRGNEDNVLERFYECAKKYNFNKIIRLTADCPLICPKELKKLSDFYKSSKADYAYFDESYPEGICADIFSFKTLEKSYKNAYLIDDLEHVTPYMHKNKDTFKVNSFSLKDNMSHLRFTIDNELDYQSVYEISTNLYQKYNYHFDMYQIIEFLEKNSDIIEINKNVKRNESFNVFDLK